MNDLSSSGNLAEAILWFAFAATFVGLAWRGRGRRRRLFSLLAAAFVVFGISDLIEAQTGAWWRPVWLLVLKAGCIAVFGYGVWEYRRVRRTEGNQIGRANRRQPLRNEAAQPPPGRFERRPRADGQ